LFIFFPFENPPPFCEILGGWDLHLRRELLEGFSALHRAAGCDVSLFPMETPAATGASTYVSLTYHTKAPEAVFVLRMCVDTYIHTEASADTLQPETADPSAHNRDETSLISDKPYHLKRGRNYFPVPLGREGGSGDM